MLQSFVPLFKHIRKVERHGEVPLITALEELLLAIAQEHLVERLVEGASLAELEQWASLLADCTIAIGSCRLLLSATLTAIRLRCWCLQNALTRLVTVDLLLELVGADGRDNDFRVFLIFLGYDLLL